MSNDSKYPLTDVEIQSIFNGIVKPENISQKLFDQIISRMKRRYTPMIIGVEDDPIVKVSYQKAEIDEERSRADENIKLTNLERKKMNFPSNRNTAYPKHYSEKMKKDVISRWITRISNVVHNILTPKESHDGEELPIENDIIEKALNCIDYSSIYKGTKSGVKINYSVAVSAEKEVRKNARIELQSIRLRKERQPLFLEKYCQIFQRSLAIPGKWVGNIAAAAFGEAATQQSLNTFHFAGNASARKQITGFARFDEIIEVKDSTKSTTITAYTEKRLTSQQMRLKIHEFRATRMEDLIENSEIVEVKHYRDDGFVDDPPIPRWEHIYNAVHGIDPDVLDLKNPRFNIHRPKRKKDKNGNWSDIGNKFLKITLNIQEMFFRRITMGDIADAIEETDNNIRVVTSNMRVGIIYIYYNFTTYARAIDKGPAIPSFIHDHLEFFLQKTLIPSISNIQVSGIEGIGYIMVKHNKISAAINKRLSIMNKDGTFKLVFKERECVLWGLKESIIIEFLHIRLYRYLKPDHTLDITQKQEKIVSERETYEYINEFEYNINIKALQKRDNDGKYIEFNPKDLFDAFTDETKMAVFDMLNYVKPITVDLNTQGLTLNFNRTLLDRYQILLENILIILKDTFKCEGHLSEVNSKIILLKPKIKDVELSILELKELLKDVFDTIYSIEELSNRYYYVIEGSNILDLLAHPLIDSEYTRTDNIIDAYTIFGVETCRSVLLNEISKSVSSDMNPCHIELLADSMTYKTPGNKPLPQNRHGMGIRSTEFLAAAAFETTTAVLMASGLGLVDNVESYTSKAMVGMLKSTGGISELNKNKVLSTHPAFKYDFPEKQESAGEVDRSVTSINAVRKVPEKNQKDTRTKANRKRPQRRRK